MMFRQPRSIPAVRRQAHTSSSSVFHSDGNSGQLVAAATTAVGRAATSVIVTGCPVSL